MSLYELPEFNFSWKLKKTRRKKNKTNVGIIVSTVFLSIIFGFLAGAVTSTFLYFQFNNIREIDNELSLRSEEIQVNNYQPEDSIVNVVKKSSPAVVSIIRGESGGGTGFIVSEDGLILTNKHVVLDEDIEYKVFMNDGKEYSAEVLARDPFQDLAIIKIEPESNINEEGILIIEKFPTLPLGDSDSLEIGQTVIAIGNALAEFRNTVSSGLISGLRRRITASGGGFTEILNDVIQTDTAINKGNSGGPLLNLKGEVIGINTAMAYNAQSIGFSIPINYAKRAVRQVKNSGEIVYPFIGIRYVLINNQVKKEKDLSVDYGALIIGGDSEEPAISPGSPAEEAGLQKGDIILELDEKKIVLENSLMKILMDYNPGDEITLKVSRDNQEIEVVLTLSQRPE